MKECADFLCYNHILQSIVSAREQNMNPTPASKNCQAFMTKLHQSSHWETIKVLLMAWKDQQKDPITAIDIFKDIMKQLDGCEESDEKILEAFNRCLVKDAQLARKLVDQNPSKEKVPDSHPAKQTQNTIQPSLQLVKKQTKNSGPSDKNISSKPGSQIEEIKQPLLLSHLEKHEKSKQIIKVMNIYLKCIINLQEFKAMLTPLYQTDPSLIHSLFQIAEDVHQKRRKSTIFAPLNELIDQKYPMEQIGPSYILTPEAYANYGEVWKDNVLEPILNRKCVSVPLGSQVSFIIGKKNEFQQQLFNYQDQRYQIDNALQSLRVCEKIIIKYCSEQENSDTITTAKLASPMLKRVISDLYPGQSVYNIFIRHASLAKQILLPRLIKKKQELERMREKFVKVCEEVANKNFKKSLDYRCIYFAKNDRKYNTPIRWDLQIQMRKKQLQIEHKNSTHQQDIQDRQSLTRHREEYVNTFDHITNQNFMKNQSIYLTFDRKLNSLYPMHPDNQILFILNFKNKQILNDVLEIIMYNCNRKNLLELLVFKMMKTDIKKKIKKSSLLLNILETKEKIQNNSEIIEMLSMNKNNLKQGHSINDENSSNQNYQFEEALLNDQKSSYNKIFKDSEDQFMQMIEQEQEAAYLQDIQSPFQGPSNGYTFIATKPVYTFMRYLLTIYQRFIKAKEYSEQRSSSVIGTQQDLQGVNSENQQEAGDSKIDIYKFFLTIMIYKIRDKNKNYFEEYLRKLYCEKAFIFFTLEKLITSAAKIINTISGESLTYQILKDQTKDYQLGIFDWEKFPFPTVTNQLSRLYKEKDVLYRFTHQKNEGNIFISAWNPPFKNYINEERDGQMQKLAQNIERYILSRSKRKSIQIEPINNEKKEGEEGEDKNINQLINEKEKSQQLRKMFLKSNKTQEFIIKSYNGVLIMKGEQIFVRKDRKRPSDEYIHMQKHLKKMRKLNNVL